MNTKATVVLLMLLLIGVTSSSAQEREDIIWARDIGDAEITLDGQLNEDVWAQAEEIQLVWGERAGLPGSGWRFHGSFNIDEPVDPINATIKVLRKGNQLYVGATVPDSSIGGSKSLWNLDGLVMSFVDRVKYMEFATNPAEHQLTPDRATSEYFVTWWHQADTTAAGAPTPGAEPRLHGKFGSPNDVVSKERTAEQVAAFDAATVVDGTTNDDTHGNDEGYVIEMRADLSVIGYDATQPEGEMVPASFTIYDSDYQWPIDDQRFSTTKVWFQNQWGNNLNEGAALIMMHPSVTIDTPESAFPEVAPDFVIPSGSSFDDPVVDGVLDDPVWQELDYQIQFQYKNPDVNNMLPGYGPWFVQWFRPGDRVAPVVDPSLGKIKFFHKDTNLYVGIDVDDQAIAGNVGEEGDGMGLIISHRDSLDGDNTLHQVYLSFAIDSTGAIRPSRDAAQIMTDNPDAITAAAALKGESTPANPSDVDEGYTFEIVIDLTEVAGYDEDLNDRWLWVGAHLYDSDNFEDETQNYAIRTWWLRERNTGPGAFALMDPNTVVDTERDITELPGQITLHGNFPNPFNPSTTLRYALPEAGDVTVEVFDLLGRQVAQVKAGLQLAGENHIAFDATTLASGVYMYRLRVMSPADSQVRVSQTGRMVLLK